MPARATAQDAANAVGFVAVIVNGHVRLLYKQDGTRVVTLRLDCLVPSEVALTV